LVIVSCDKCGKSLGVIKNKHVNIVMDQASVYRQEWEFDLCIECAEMFDSFLDSFKTYKVPVYERVSSSEDYDYDNDNAVNQATDVWGGAGPDCSSIRVTPVSLFNQVFFAGRMEEA